MTKKRLLWWLTVCVQLLLIAVAGFYGFFNFVVENDVTHLSELIFVTWALTTIVIGLKLFRSYSDDYTKQWFFAEACMTVGMIGTVIGFLIMLSGAFGQLDPSNVTLMKQVIGEMATGLSTALITTLNGLIASLFVKLQIIIVEDHA